MLRSVNPDACAVPKDTGEENGVDDIGFGQVRRPSVMAGPASGRPVYAGLEEVVWGSGDVMMHWRHAAGCG